MATHKMRATLAHNYQPPAAAAHNGTQTAGWLARWPVVGVTMFLFGSLMFSALAYNLVAQGPLLRWDNLIANTLPAAGLKSPPIVKTIMDAGFFIGEQVIVVLAVLLGLYFIYKKYWRELTLMVLGLAGSSLLFLILSHLFNRARPVTQIWIVLHVPGFPSGHSISVVVFYGLLAYLWVPKVSSTISKIGVAAAALFLMAYVGFSRVFTAGHYLTDILAGYAVGIAWFGLIYTLIEIYFQKKSREKIGD
jgi:membrane-associated phospholipid phosphatase